MKNLFFSTALFAFALAVAASAFAGDGSTSGQVASAAASVAGRWEVSWQARLGTEQAVVELEQHGSRLTGTFRDPHHTCPVSGTIDGKNLSFEVQFQVARPYTIAFKGTVDGEKMSGTSQAQNVGGNGAYLGHGGEIVQPEHPWTATRPADPPSLQTQKTKPGSSSSSN